MQQPVTLESPLRLPSGALLPNRLVKAAMTEGLADADLQPTERLVRLYGRWARGGAGLLLTGNVQIDRRCLERPGNVALEPGDPRFNRASFEAWAKVARDAGAEIWMQISHAGRQVPRYVNPRPLAPSDSSLAIPGGLFGRARALSVGEIQDIIERFAYAAGVARDTGFSGVEIHSAHGYLLSEFLSPRVNQRTDEWGGSLANRARLLLDVVRATRRRVGPQFPVAVKLNSADFQRGGFDEEDSVRVVEWLGQEGIDVLEISGGTYEQPQMFDREGLSAPVGKRKSTLEREAYFLEYAARVGKIASMPILVTGGFRSRAAMDAALESGDADLVGLARPLCVDPDLPRRLLQREVARASSWEDQLRIGTGWLSETSPVDLLRAVNVLGAQAWFCRQIVRLADGNDANPELGVGRALLEYQVEEIATANRVKKAGRARR